MLEKQINEYNKDTLMGEFGDEYPRGGTEEEEELSTSSAPQPPPPYNPEFEIQDSTSSATVVSAPATAPSVSDEKHANNTQKTEVGRDDKEKEEASTYASGAAASNTETSGSTETVQEEREPERTSAAHRHAILVAVMQFFILLGLHTKRLTKEACKKAVKLNEKHQLTSRAKESVNQSATFVKQSSIRAKENVVELGKKHEICPKVKRTTQTVKRQVQRVSEVTVQNSIRVREKAKDFNERHQIGPKAKYTTRMMGRQIKRASKATAKSARELVGSVESSSTKGGR